ncbi:hypothetical protein BDZ91DRAFT_658551, partial [Kalaharituber pfeilii]
RTRIVTAYSTADKYDLVHAIRLLRTQGYIPDPFATGLLDQVIHLRISLGSPSTTTIPPSAPVSVGPHNPSPAHILSVEERGDIFVFPSGNIVSWAVPEAQISALASTLVPAAENPVLDPGEVESEDLEFVEDPGSRRSWVKGDVIFIGTAMGRGVREVDGVSALPPQMETLPVLLSKIAFSSGLSRSTKLAHLESLLSTYLSSTASIPHLLSTGSRLPFTRSFILRKTGELLSFRAQLNLYSELTDSLPDLFWDSKHELGLEGCYESVGRALDVETRIRQLNGKMDYASEIVKVLRERLSEKHGLVLEWMIIVLIAVEVGFEVLRMVKERWRERRRRSERAAAVLEDASWRGGEEEGKDGEPADDEIAGLRRELKELAERQERVLGALEELERRRRRSKPGASEPPPKGGRDVKVVNTFPEVGVV